MTLMYELLGDKANVRQIDDSWINGSINLSFS